MKPETTKPKQKRDIFSVKSIREKKYHTLQMRDNYKKKGLSNQSQ